VSLSPGTTYLDFTIGNPSGITVKGSGFPTSVSDIASIGISECTYGSTWYVEPTSITASTDGTQVSFTAYCQTIGSRPAGMVIENLEELNITVTITPVTTTETTQSSKGTVQAGP
jgi:hypothetical protein